MTQRNAKTSSSAVARVVDAPGPRPSGVDAGESAGPGESLPKALTVTCPHCATESGIVAPEPVVWSEQLSHLAAVLSGPESVVAVKAECGACGQAFWFEHPQQPGDDVRAASGSMSPQDVEPVVDRDVGSGVSASS